MVSRRFYDSRAGDLGNNASLAIETNTHLLPGSRGGTIKHVSIGLASASRGPCLADAVIFQGGDIAQIMIMEPQMAVRSDPDAGFEPDVYVVAGDYPYLPASVIFIRMSNDSGSQVNFFAGWSGVRDD